MIERHRRQRDVAERLDQYAAEPDHQQRTPVRIAVDAEDDFASGRRHRLHQDAVDARVRRVSFRGGEHTLVSSARAVVGNIERHRARFGLVRNRCV